MNYQTYNYIPIDTLVAEIKEELSSYFQAGAVSDVMIPTYVNQCLRKLKGIVLKPERVMLFFDDYTSQLPNDFHLLEWAISYSSEAILTGAIPSTVGFYSKAMTCTGECSEEFQQTCEVFEKITVPTGLGMQTLVMHDPKWIRVYYGAKPMCTEDCPNVNINVTETITIQEKGKVVSTFQRGCVHVQYLSKPIDDNGLPMIPEFVEVEEYIKSYVKFKLFEQLMNSVVDETFNQIKYKFEYYRQDSLNKLAACSILLLPSKQKTADNVVNSRKKFIKYHIR